MFLKINGKEESLEDKTTLGAFVEKRSLNRGAIVIEHNLEIIPREKWDETFLRDGDSVEVVHFIGGG